MEAKEIGEIKQALTELDARLLVLEGERPKTDLLRRGLLGRAFGIWGYMLLAQLAVVVVLIWVVVIVMSAFWFISYGGGR